LKVLNNEVAAYQQGGNPDLNVIIEKLIDEADEALGRGLYTVVDKASAPADGDKHNYWSLAPYWWPDPSSPDGMPYIRKDGQWYPEAKLYGPNSGKYDRTRLREMFVDSTILTLAWKFTGNKKYASHAADILRHFFINSATKMNPNLKYAQVKLGHMNNLGGAPGIIEGEDFYYYLDTVKILVGSGAITNRDLYAFKKWLSEYLQWLLESDQGVTECAATNNHGIVYDLQVASIAEFLRDKSLLNAAINRAESRIDKHFKADGSQPEELARTNTLHYCLYNYQIWIHMATIAKKMGNNFWTRTEDYRLRTAGRWLLSFHGKKWPHMQINNIDDATRFACIRWTIPESITSRYSKKFKKSIYENEPVSDRYTRIDPNANNGVQPFWNIGAISIHDDA